MIKPPGFLVFRDEVYIAENGAGYKTAKMRIAHSRFSVVQSKRRTGNGKHAAQIFSFDRVNSAGL
jgi:hypothetical protein